MKLLEHIALGIAAIICAGVLEMAIAAAGAAMDVWRENENKK